MISTFCHVELNTADTTAATAFYNKLFGWKTTAMPGMAYTMIETGTDVGGGIQQKPMPEAPNHWLPYVEVASVKKAIATAKKLGANVVVDFMPLPDMGAIGIFVDPQGAALGVWEPEQKAPAKKAPAKKPAAKKGGKKK